MYRSTSSYIENLRGRKKKVSPKVLNDKITGNTGHKVLAQEQQKGFEK